MEDQLQFYSMKSFKLLNDIGIEFELCIIDHQRHVWHEKLEVPL